MGKRGQVTAFVVLGLVILAALAIVLYTKQDVLRSAFSREKAKLTSVPEQAKSVQAFIDSCVDQITQEGITLLARQGGYINIPNDNYPKGVGNPFSNVLEIIPNLNLP